MTSLRSTLSILLLAGILITGCKQETAGGEPTPETTSASDTLSANPLPSWNEGATKKAITDFVTAAVTEGDPGFIHPDERIATFDNDGTLWSEQPAYFQLLFAVDRVKAMAGDHPEWKNTQPYKAILEDDMETLKKMGMKGIGEIVMTTHAGMTPEEFRKIVSDWMATARHPKTGKPYNEMIFKPMLELLEYLRANGFRTFIVSGGGAEFMRSWVEEAYGIPTYQVVGTTFKTEFVLEDGKGVIKRLPELEFIDDKEGKPIGINRFIGKVPVFAAGNSDGDLQMLQYSDSRDPSFQLYLHHTDSIREWAYDRDSHIGGLDKGLDEAQEKGWIVIDMAKDWNTIYP